MTQKLSGLVCNICRKIITKSSLPSPIDGQHNESETIHICSDPNCIEIYQEIANTELEKANKHSLDSTYYWRRKKEING